MSDDTNPVIRYSVSDLFQQIQQKIDNLAALLAGSQNRMAALEQQSLAAGQLAGDFEVLRRDFIGMEKRFSLHESAATHPSATASWATLVLDVEQLKAERATRQRLEDYITRQQERQTTDARWRVGLVLGLVGQTIAFVGLIAKVSGWLG